MKYLLFLLLFVAGLGITSCDNDSCEEGKYSFYDHCFPLNDRVFYFGKPAYFCFEDSLAIGINTETKLVSVKFANASGQHGGIGDFNYTERDNFHDECKTPEYGDGETYTVCYFDDVSVLDDLPPSIKVNIYQTHIGPPYTKYDSTTLIMYRR